MTPEKLYFHIRQCVPDMYDFGFITADHPDCHNLPWWDQSISSFIYLGVCNIVSFCWKTPSVGYLIFSNEAWEKQSTIYIGVYDFNFLFIASDPLALETCLSDLMDYGYDF